MARVEIRLAAGTGLVIHVGTQTLTIRLADEAPGGAQMCAAPTDPQLRAKERALLAAALPRPQGMCRGSQAESLTGGCCPTSRPARVTRPSLEKNEHPKAKALRRESDQTRMLQKI
jgi:hypothetical protein